MSKYPSEFRQHRATLVVEGGCGVRDVARGLGLNQETPPELGSWTLTVTDGRILSTFRRAEPLASSTSLTRGRIRQRRSDGDVGELVRRTENPCSLRLVRWSRVARVDASNPSPAPRTSTAAEPDVR